MFSRNVMCAALVLGLSVCEGALMRSERSQSFLEASKALEKAHLDWGTYEWTGVDAEIERWSRPGLDSQQFCHQARHNIHASDKLRDMVWAKKNGAYSMTYKDVRDVVCKACNRDCTSDTPCTPRGFYKTWISQVESDCKKDGESCCGHEGLNLCAVEC